MARGVAIVVRRVISVSSTASTRREPLAFSTPPFFGILFGACLLRTHGPLVPIGLHFGLERRIAFLGVELSGLTIRVTGTKLVWKLETSEWRGEYGPEGSILCSVALVLLALAVWKVLSTAAALICSTIQTRRGTLGALIVALTPLAAAVIPAKDKLTDDEKSKSCAMSRPNLPRPKPTFRAPKNPSNTISTVPGTRRLAAPRPG